MKICIISDTHNKHKQIEKLPDADCIIHCGDFSSKGYAHEIKNFMKWFSNLNQYKYKILIAGNHDLLFEQYSSLAKSLIPDNIIYLEDSGINIEGINFYGSPVQPEFYNWAFNRTEDKLLQHWNAIPENVDILITHGSPKNILDYVEFDRKHVGSYTLYESIVNRIKPLVNCFGHIHGSRGYVVENNITFINASVLNEQYEYTNIPFLIEIIDKKVRILNK